MLPYRIRNGLARAKFNIVCRGIWRTPPVARSGSSVAVVSMVSRPDLTMYLVAIKSFLARGIIGEVHVLDDGSLRPHDVQRLNEHIPFCKVQQIGSVDVPEGCPRGGCWERLTYLADLNQDRYVIQLDSDTLSLGTLTSVQDLVTEDRSFVICGDAHQNEIVGFREVIPPEGDHVQSRVERVLTSHPSAGTSKYVRGCAGFSGFAPATATIEAIKYWSVTMSELVGDTAWQQWGSEQITSNLIVANATASEVLPFPNYTGFFPEVIGRSPESELIHFIGANRFKHGSYARLAKQFIRSSERHFDATEEGHARSE